ncbi:MAG: KilA-N domain-containing protein [Polaromonas sp.]|nr:KilA-N domain-containing protein [Polaromonas sp.]
MVTSNSKSMVVKGVEVHITSKDDEDYISLTDMTTGFAGAEQLIKNWLQNKNTIDFLGVWEQLNNPSFNLVEFHQIRNDAGLNRFVMSAKQWVERAGGIGLLAKAGRYGGTFAHKDIAFEFGSWLSPEFKLYLIKEFQRLKEQEAISGGLEWSIRRSLSKVQYRVHTDAIKNNLIPQDVGRVESGYVYATEADMLNKALFGMTAKEWKAKNPKAVGNIRDGATMKQLVVLSSLESQNALLIQQKMPQSQRVVTLNALARAQLIALLENPSMKKLDGGAMLG